MLVSKIHGCAGSQLLEPSSQFLKSGGICENGGFVWTKHTFWRLAGGSMQTCCIFPCIFVSKRFLRSYSLVSDQRGDQMGDQAGRIEGYFEGHFEGHFAEN